jgi:hypothetical protein
MVSALTRRFVLVLVLESGRAECWSVGVLEYCAKSELHLRSGLGMPTPGNHLLPPLPGGSSLGRTRG